MLCRLLIATVLAVFSLGAQAQLERLSENVYLLHGKFEPGRQPDGNSVLLKGAGGWVLIDSGRHAAHTQVLLDFTEGRIKAVINSHWHLDHLGGNALLRRTLPELSVYASAATDEALKTWFVNSRRQMQDLLQDKRMPEAGKAQIRIDLALLEQTELLAPDRRIRAAQSLTLAGRALQVGLETAVSGGDIWVFDEVSRTLMVGDLVTLPVPFFETACASDWSAALDRVEALPFDRVVPGHGPVMSRAELYRYREAMEELLQCAGSDRPVAQCASAWRSGLEGLISDADKPRVEGMLAYYFKQQLRAPEAQRRKFCTKP